MTQLFHAPARQVADDLSIPEDSSTDTTISIVPPIFRPLPSTCVVESVLMDTGKDTGKDVRVMVKKTRDKSKFKSD